MEDLELKNLWVQYNTKLDENLKLNKKIAEITMDSQLKVLLNSMKPIKIASIVIGILWIFFIDNIIINTFGVASIFFTVSAIIQSIITKLAIGIYLYQLITIQQVDISQPILQIQEKLASLKTSTLWVTRILFLQLPVWSTFFLHKALFSVENLPWLVVQAIVTFALFYLSIWLFMNIKPASKDKKWFQWLFTGKEWNPILKSIDLLDDIKEYRS